MAFHFQISANMLSWPRSCACCGGDADRHLRASASRTTGKRVRRTTTAGWDVPYCGRCLEHCSRYNAAAGWLWAGLIGAVVLGVGIGQVTNGAIGLFTGLIAAATSPILYNRAHMRAKAIMLPECACATPAVQYLEWHGSFHTFIFGSRPYLDAFLAANVRKNRSDIRQV